MTHHNNTFDISRDDLAQYGSHKPAFVTFGEVMVRDTPADSERLERTRHVSLSYAGSEFTLAMMVARLGISSAFVTRVPENPYGWHLRNLAREQNVNTDHFVWADKAEPIGRLLYELGRSPRPGKGWYQRKYSAASKLGAGMVDWRAALRDARLFHTSGISFGLSAHCDYDRNFLMDAFEEALDVKPQDCLVGLDFNYRNTLWSPAVCADTMTPILKGNIDVLITTIEDMARIYGMKCGNLTADTIVKGDISTLVDAEVEDFLSQLIDRFELRIAAVTIRYPDSQEQHRWESAAMNDQGEFARSDSEYTIVLKDRLGGGDTWNGGFYYGILTENDPVRGMKKGVVVGDAATRLKQTIMFDLPIVTRQEIQALIESDSKGGGRRTSR